MRSSLASESGSDDSFQARVRSKEIAREPQDLPEPFQADIDGARGPGRQIIGELADASVRERTFQLDRTRGGRLDDEGDVIVADQAGTAARPLRVRAG